MKKLLRRLFNKLSNKKEKSFTNLIKVGKGWSGSSINTSIFRKDSIVSFRENQYISFYDKSGNLIIGKRKLGSHTWHLKKTGLKGNVSDAHCSISMAIDGEGYLHVVYGLHNQKIKYARSEKPESLTLISIDKTDGIEEDTVTYPEFHKLSSEDLILVYRSGLSANGNMVLKIYDSKSGEWSTLQQNLIDGEGERNAYWQMCIGKDDTIHVSWVWREAPDVASNHDLCYAKSHDYGKTWIKSDGTVYNLPITAPTAEIIETIPQNSSLINQTSMCVDESGYPYIATYWKEENEEAPNYRVIWFNGYCWQKNKLYEKKLSFELKGKGTKKIPISRPLILSSDKKIYVIFRDKEFGHGIKLAVSEDIESGDWSIKDLASFDVDMWEPTIDSDLWKKNKLLDVFVQTTHQIDGGDNKKTVSTKPTDVFVLEYRP